MLSRPRAQSHGRLTTRFALFWASSLAFLALVFAPGCEDKEIGRPCDITVDAGAAYGVYNSNATDCPSHLCTKPAVQAGISLDLDTGAYCTALCSSNSDCSNGQTRDLTNPNDTRCKKGFVCAIPFDQGPVCCQKMCLCRDFFVTSVGPTTPAICTSDAGSCS